MAARDLALEGRVFVGIKAIVFVAVAVHGGLHDEFQVLGNGLGAGDEGRDLLLFLDLPVDVFLDIGVIDVDNDHLGRTAGGAARLDGAGSAVTDLQEAHQAGRLAAARQALAFAAQGREIGAGARAVFEQTCFADPEVHDAVLVDEVVVDRLNEAGVGLGMLVGRFGLDEFMGERVDIEMALAGAVDAIGPVQTGVEPLRGIGCNALGGEHVAQLVIEGAGIVFGREIAALPAPVCPGAGEAIKNLACIGFGTVAALPSANPSWRRRSASERHSQDGTEFSSTFFRRAGTPALRKYFWARISAATWENCAGTVDIRETEHDRAIGIA